MTEQEVLNQNWTKTAKAKALYSLGYTRSQVATLICNGNYGFAHNIWKKWNEELSAESMPGEFEFDFNRTFGIELEIYNASRSVLIRELRREGVNVQSESYNHNTSNHWKIVSDSSIDGVHGNEIVSPVLKGAEGIEEVKKVCIALKRAKAKVNKSCGFHLHIGVNDYTLDDFKNLVKSYINLEKNFDKIQPISRRKNNNFYCQNLSSVSNIYPKINRSSSVSELTDIFEDRYFKLNLKSFSRYGTVEFRHHSGTTQFSKIKNWILICSRLTSFSKNQGVTNNFKSFLNESLYDYTEDRAVDLVA